jgi:hypothetical protein
LLPFSSKGAITPKAAEIAARKLPGSTKAQAAAAAAAVKLLPLVFRVFSLLNPEDFHTFSAARCTRWVFVHLLAKPIAAGTPAATSLRRMMTASTLMCSETTVLWYSAVGRWP